MEGPTSKTLWTKRIGLVGIEYKESNKKEDEKLGAHWSKNCLSEVLGHEYDKNTMYKILWGLINISKIKTISIKEQNANIHICSYIDDYLPLIKFFLLKWFTGYV